MPLYNYYANHMPGPKSTIRNGFVIFSAFFFSFAHQMHELYAVVAVELDIVSAFGMRTCLAVMHAIH